MEIEFEDGLREEVTAHAGVSLLVETARRSGVIAAVDRALPTKKNPKGLTQGQMVESLVVLSASGGVICVMVKGEYSACCGSPFRVM